MRQAREAPDLTILTHTDVEALMHEVSRYLDVVDEFRALECEPTWRPEPAAIARLAESTAHEARVEKTAH